MPPETRTALWALYAFNYEIARTREVVTETQLGLIRLQWWRDAVAAIYEGKESAGNPVIADLAKVIRDHDLPKDEFDQLVYAREFDLEDRQPSTIEGMVKYAELTSVPLMRLALCVCQNPSRVPAQGHEAVAMAYALTGLLRAIPAHLRQRRCYLPQDMTPPVEELYEGQGLDRMTEVVRAVAEEAEVLLNMPGKNTSRLIRAHQVLARIYLKQIKSLGYNVFNPRMTIPPFLREARVWWGVF